MSLEDNPHITCPWPDCQCTHVGCVAGWIDTEEIDPDTEHTVQTTRPCPTCRPEVAVHFNKKASMRKLRTSLPNLPRPSRS